MSGSAREASAAAAAAQSGLSDRDFERFRTLVHRRTGIFLGPQKRHLLCARLGRRLRALGLASLGQYYALLERPEHADEAQRFVNAITTNKTDFYRESHHFTWLLERWAPERRAAAARGGPRRARVWSTACSTGEEPYSIAITLREARLVPPQWDTRILATDIDTEVLARARAGVYPAEGLTSVPPALLRRHFLRSRGAATHVKVRPEVAGLVAFRHLNLSDAAWPVRAVFDVIFCRNVLIYFDREGQRRVLERLLSVLRPGGYLLLGHSESAYGLAGGLTHIGHTIYQWTGGRDPGPGAGR